MSGKFIRPAEFDPLARNGGKKAALRDEFGMSDSDDAEEVAGITLTDTTSQSGGGASSADLQKAKKEAAALKKKNSELTVELEDTKKSLAKLKKLSSEASTIHESKYKELVDKLTDDFENQKQELRLACVQAGADKSKLDAKMKDMTRSTQLLRENTKLKQEIKALEKRSKELDKDILEYKVSRQKSFCCHKGIEYWGVMLA